MKAGQGYSYKA